MVIKVLGISECIKKFGDISHIDMTPEIIEATRKVQRTAIDLAPISTDETAPNREHGRLKASIKTQIVNKNTPSVYGIVYSDVFYAIYVEFGTRFMRPQSFLIPSMNIHRLGILSSMGKYLRAEIAKFGKTG